MTEPNKWTRWASLDDPCAWFFSTREEAEALGKEVRGDTYRVTIEAVAPAPERAVTLRGRVWRRDDFGQWRVDDRDLVFAAPDLAAALDALYERGK